MEPVPMVETIAKGSGGHMNKGGVLLYFENEAAETQEMERRGQVPVGSLFAPRIMGVVNHSHRPEDGHS